jgi:hypothetical protein
MSPALFKGAHTDRSSCLQNLYSLSRGNTSTHARSKLSSFTHSTQTGNWRRKLTAPLNCIPQCRNPGIVGGFRSGGRNLRRESALGCLHFGSWMRPEPRHGTGTLRLQWGDIP